MKKTTYKWIIALLIILGGGTSYCLYAAPHKRVSNLLESPSPTQAESRVYPAVWKAEQAANQQNIFSVSVSPDGKYTLIETKLPSFPAKGPQSKLTVVENVSSKIIWETEPEPFLFPQWSPKGDQITFLIADKKETQLVIGALDKWEPRQLFVTNEEVKGYKWAPDGEKIVVISTNSSYKEENKRSFTVGSQSNSIKFSFVSLNKNFKGKKINLEGYVFPPFDVIEKVIAWSPDSKNLAFPVFSQDERAEALFNLEVESENTVVLHPHGNPLCPSFSPDGTKIAYVADLSEKEKSLFKVKRRRVYVKENNVNKSTPLAATFAEDPVLIGWFPDGQKLLVQEGYKTLNHLYKLPISEEKIELIDTENTEHLFSHLSLNATKTHLGFVQESLSIAPSAYISRLDSFEPQPVFPKNYSVTLPMKSESITWKSFDGTEIEGLLVYPFDYKAGRKYPLLIALHDGPYGTWKRNFIGLCSEAVPFSPAVFASNGYAILLPNIRGSSNYGVEFAKAIDKDIGGTDYKDLITGIESLVSKGIADPDRLALWGWGYGGYLATWATTQTDRFKVALVGAGITDLISFAGTTSEIGYLESYLGGYFWDNKPLWLSRSPIMHVPTMKTPTLLLYGEKDKIFPTSQGDQLYYALKSKDIPVKMMTFNHESHSFNFSPSFQEGLKLALEWFDLYLQPERSENSSFKKNVQKNR